MATSHATCTHQAIPRARVACRLARSLVAQATRYGLKVEETTQEQWVGQYTISVPNGERWDTELIVTAGWGTPRVSMKTAAGNWESCPFKKARYVLMAMQEAAQRRAHESDLGFITVLYTSLITQMQTMMAQDERVEKIRGFRGATPGAWRVSYAYGWVNRISVRLAELKARTETEATTEPGTALVLRDRGASVVTFVADSIGKTRKTNYKLHDTSAAGRASGYAAGGRADLGQDKVGGPARRALGS